MKLLVVTEEYVHSQSRYLDSKGWSFKKSFEKLGIDVKNFFYKKKDKLVFLEKQKGIKKLWHAYVNRQLLSHVTRTRPDVVFIGKGDTITPGTLWDIRRKTDAVIVSVFPDNPLYTGNFDTIAPCHFFFVKDTYVLDVLRKAGLGNVHYLPQCTDPDVHRPLELTAEDRKLYGADVSLIGSMYPYRLKVIEELAGFRPALWGRGWSRSGDEALSSLARGRDVRGTEKAKVICATGISLNPHHPLNDIHGVNRRTYDIAACRGFQLTEYKPDLEKLFGLGDEMVCYRSLEELKEQIGYYHARPGEREKIAEAAYRRVLREHTYDHRARTIVDMVRHSRRK